MMPLVTKPLTSGSKAEGRFGKQDFVYLPEANAYRCPAGELLTWRFTSVEEGARHFMAVNPGWSLARIAKELAVPASYIEELFPERAAAESPIVKKVRSALADHPDWTPEQIAKRIKRPKSVVMRALRMIGQ